LAEILAWIEGSALGQAVRQSGVWAYGVLNLLHILGIATLFGSVLLLDLRLLGAWRRVSLVNLAAPAVPVAAAGLALAALSGACMLSTNASDYLGNPFLYAKFPLIALALLNVALLGRVPAWRERGVREPKAAEQRVLALFGGSSLLLWLGAIGAGRMIGYW
jgi:hypothetical protein